VFDHNDITVTKAKQVRTKTTYTSGIVSYSPWETASTWTVKG
jgi:hypothetical protein